jgi:hypothetical protein
MKLCGCAYHLTPARLHYLKSTTPLSLRRGGAETLLFQSRDGGEAEHHATTNRYPIPFMVIISSEGSSLR